MQLKADWNIKRRIHTLLLCFYGIVLYFICSSALAKNESVVSYQFESTLDFVKEMSVVDGAMDIYSWKQNTDVQLIIGSIGSKALYLELTKLKEADIKTFLLNSSLSTDALNGIYSRNQVEFQIQKQQNSYFISTKYQTQGRMGSFDEIKNYVVSDNGVAYSAISYPQKMNEKIIQQILNSKVKITFNHKSAKLENGKDSVVMSNDIDNKIDIDANEPTEFSLGGAINSLVDKAASLSKIFVNLAFADNACSASSYVLKGDYVAGKPGNALFNFSKLVSDLELQLQTNPAEKSKVDCMSKLAQQTLDDSYTYWATRAIKENCMVDSKIPSTKPENCPAATFEEWKRSSVYIDSLKNRINVVIESSIKPTQAQSGAECKGDCAQSVKNDPKKELATVAQSTKEMMCCGIDGSGKEQSPMIGILSQEITGFTKFPAQTQYQICTSRIKEDPTLKRNSAMGYLDCTGNILKGLVDTIKQALVGLVSLFDLDTYIGIGKFIANIRTAGPALLNVIGDQIASKVFAAKNCMNDYEQMQYVCKMSVPVITSLVSPAAISRFLKAVAKGIKGKLLGELIGEVISKDKNIQKASKLVAKESKPGKIPRTFEGEYTRITESKATPSLQVLSKEVKTSTNKMVEGKIQKLLENKTVVAEASNNTSVKVIKGGNNSIVETPKPTPAANAAKTVADRSYTYEFTKDPQSGVWNHGPSANTSTPRKNVASTEVASSKAPSTTPALSGPTKVTSPKVAAQPLVKNTVSEQPLASAKKSPRGSTYTYGAQVETGGVRSSKFEWLEKNADIFKDPNISQTTKIRLGKEMRDLGFTAAEREAIFMEGLDVAKESLRSNGIISNLDGQRLPFDEEIALHRAHYDARTLEQQMDATYEILKRNHYSDEEAIAHAFSHNNIDSIYAIDHIRERWISNRVEQGNFSLEDAAYYGNINRIDVEKIILESSRSNRDKIDVLTGHTLYNREEAIEILYKNSSDFRNSYYLTANETKLFWAMREQASGNLTTEDLVKVVKDLKSSGYQITPNEFDSISSHLGSSTVNAVKDALR